jgi:hypothetical protein
MLIRADGSGQLLVTRVAIRVDDKGPQIDDQTAAGIAIDESVISGKLHGEDEVCGYPSGAPWLIPGTRVPIPQG